MESEHICKVGKYTVGSVTGVERRITQCPGHTLGGSKSSFPLGLTEVRWVRSTTKPLRPKYCVLIINYHPLISHDTEG